jgi:membrane-bound metal-dependent hydrolase YbcI (DUF457 family)
LSTASMDTITHGIAGALIGKGVFRGGDMFARGPVTRGRVITWSLMLGAIFPDSDVFREFFSNNELLILTWHRSITHSLLCLPAFALALAGLTRWFVRWCKWEAPSFVALAGVYAIGILSHILLDLVTSFGTMIWSPLKWSRPAWDLIFIIDFTFAAILLAPQFIAWVYSRPEGLQRRALGSWAVFCLGTLGAAGIGRAVRAPFTASGIFAAIVVLTALFLLPALRGWGLRVSAGSWNRAGFAAALGYVALAVYFHHAALARVEQFASQLHLEVRSFGALPYAPSLWQWDGLVQTPRGVYQTGMDLSERASSDPGEPAAWSYRYYPDAPPNRYISAAMQLHEVQVVLWFSRFPVTRFHQEGASAVVEIADVRFAPVRQDRPAGFTYRVRFDAEGNVLSQGWVRP